jgi:hypothetical protein
MIFKIIKNNSLGLIFLILLSVFAGLSASQTASADIEQDLMAEFARLEKQSDAAGLDWFNLAIKAREADKLDIAGQALDKAESATFSPIRIGIERARQSVVADDREGAVATLRGLFDQGFATVSVLVSDADIHSMLGYPPYDSLVAEMSVQAYPCEHEPGFRDFDFWIGTWDVHLANGTPAGSNTISRQERGCVLVERWQSAIGGTGMSINYLDVATNEWVQIWNAESGTQISIRGGLTDEGMSMTGTINLVSNGTTLPFRALWTPLEDGRVRQYFEQSNDGGETWVPWFEGFYTRAGE